MKRIFTIVVLIASLVFTSCEDFPDGRRTRAIERGHLL